MGITTQSPNLPTNPVGLYYVYWSPFKPLSQWSQRINMFFLFHAYPADGEAVGGDTGAVVLRKPSGAIGASLNSEIATVRARGQRVLVSVGGAGGQVYIQTKARADAFIASFKSINEELGGSGTTLAIDGLDWNNFEGTSLAGQAQWMTYVGQQLKAFYGDQFIITSPPAGFSLAGPGPQPTSDRQLLATMYAGDALDWFCPQYYDPSNLNTVENVRLGMNVYKAPVTVDGQTISIPDDHVGIGFGITSEPGTTARWSPSNAFAAYNTMVSEGQNPKGGFNWANYEDTGELFANQVAIAFTNNADPVITNPAFTLAASANVTTGEATTAQLTPPSGKTSGADFQAGYVNEATNPHAPLDLDSGKYTELEYVITATDDAEDAAVYEFRVTYDGVVLDSYPVTPTWTIGTPPAPPDTTAPSVPANLAATAVSQSQINLSWSASTDDTGVTNYLIYRDGSLVATLGNVTSYADTGLTPSTLYSYTVSARDAATNESAQSSSASATTDAAPNNPPTISVSGINNGDTVSDTINPTITVNDPDGAGDIVAVRFYVDGTLTATDTSSPYATPYDTTNASDGIHSLYWEVEDTAGATATSGPINVTFDNNGQPNPPVNVIRFNGPITITGVGTITF